ncbi:MAG: TonB-dependent receptor [Phenylobacterium sp.]|nr:TonB-dependent receptor [Phenylobacterium sp.]
MRTHLISHLISTAAAAALIPACAFAQAAPPPTAANASELVITATRLPSRLDLVTGAHVIDRAELEARQTPFLEDVLATIPGVGITRNGGFGGLAAIRIRGASPDKTLVLIDGVPVGNASEPNGAFDPSSLQTVDIERIEVLNGPQGSLWGSDAIGGVVSITTRQVTGVNAAFEGGRYGTVRGYVGAGVSEDRYAVSASVAGLKTDGFSKADTGAEADPYKTITANLSGRLTLSDAVQLEARGRYTYSRIAIDGFPPPNFTLADTSDVDAVRAWQGDVRALVDALGWKHTLSLSDYHFWLGENSSFPASNHAERKVWRWTAERGGPADPWGLVLGAERASTTADLSGRGGADLSTTSAFAVGRIAPWRPLTLTGSLRFDDPDRFASRTTGRLAAALDLGRGFTLTASAGQGFKVPSISEVICDFCFAPPVPLRPERAEGYDLRLGWASEDGRITAALTGYKLSVRDQIAYVALRYINIARTRSDGIEAEADAKLTETLRLKLAYAVTDAIDVSTGRDLLRVPRQSGAASLFWTQQRWGAAVTLRAESTQADVARDGFTPVRRAGFAVADLSGSYRLSDQLTLTARVENLTDKRYEESFGFNESGRAAFVGVRVTE